jgi:hypothetical protein
VKKSPFYKEADLMVRLIPEVAKEACFALKGGTAINFFWRDMPRLSVDIDLAYLPVENRDLSLSSISSALDRIAISLEKVGSGLKVHRSLTKGGSRIEYKSLAKDLKAGKTELLDRFRGYLRRLEICKK